RNLTKKADIKHPASRGHKVENHHPEGETYDVLSIQREDGNRTKILVKSDSSPKKQKKGHRHLLGNCLWLSERKHSEERKTIERGVADCKQKYENGNETEQM
ncbi:unnamed protein product, partial [Ascophyllum nodosum]